MVDFHAFLVVWVDRYGGIKIGRSVEKFSVEKLFYLERERDIFFKLQNEIECR